MVMCGVTAAAVQEKCMALCHRKRGLGFAVFCIIGTIGLFLSAKYMYSERNIKMAAFMPIIIGMTGTSIITIAKICDLCHTKKKESNA